MISLSRRRDQTLLFSSSSEGGGGGGFFQQYFLRRRKREGAPSLLKKRGGGPFFFSPGKKPPPWEKNSLRGPPFAPVPNPPRRPLVFLNGPPFLGGVSPAGNPGFPGSPPRGFRKRDLSRGPPPRFGKVPPRGLNSLGFECRVQSPGGLKFLTPGLFPPIINPFGPGLKVTIGIVSVPSCSNY